ncbi:succinic semialdehyde dehydrogenase [Aureobasidium pullulans]|nr:succinic semialdehyde dehydrogenase [Aureobasidium pullulans]
MHEVPPLANPALFKQKNLINGRWVDSVSGKTFSVIDPATEKEIGRCPESVEQDVEAAITVAKDALATWRTKSGRERARILRSWYDLLLVNKGDIATLITWENGKAKPDATGEVLFAASFLEWFSEEAAHVGGDVLQHSNPTHRLHVIKEPVGVCGMITPWNFPAGMVARKLAPALAAGCTAVVKTAGETPFTANAMAVLALEAGVPSGVINIVTALENTPRVGQVLCSSQDVRKISFTGSTRVGKILMRQCSESPKKLSLELGGNAPFIVFDDCNLDEAVAGLMASKFKVSGQTCVCANRVYVQKTVHGEFCKRLVKAVAALQLGGGFTSGVTQGPLIGPLAVAKVGNHVNDAVSKGAKIAIGGRAADSFGQSFFLPTVLTGMNTEMKISSEETFGPVAALYSFSTEEEVIAVANDSEVGLAAYVYTNDLYRSTRVTEALQVGMVAINTGVISDNAAP